MLRHAAVLVLLVGLVIAPTPSRGALPQEKLFEEGIENIAAGNYTAALDVLDRALAASPESPEGYFLKASLFHILKAHFARPDYRKQWRENATKAFSLAEKMLEKNENDARALVLTGLVHGMEIVDALHRSKYFSAFGLAGSMNTHLERALEIEPKRHDAYYGLGVYHIRGSTEGWVRLFRFFVGDTSAKGREYLRRAVAGKGWTTNSAQLALVWDLLRVEKFEEARQGDRLPARALPEQRPLRRGVCGELLRRGRLPPRAGGIRRPQAGARAPERGGGRALRGVRGVADTAV